MKKISKVVVFYEDGTSDEVANLFSVAPANPAHKYAPTINWTPCKVCGDPSGHRGLACPTFSASS